MKVAVAGATGFIGGNLVRILREKGFSVVAVDKDSINLKGVEILVNCTGKLGGAGVTLKEMDEVNVDYTRKLLECCARDKVGKFIHLSSVAAMGSACVNANEDVDCIPVSDYDISKLRSEGVVKDFESRIDYVILRPSMVYGPGEVKNKFSLFKAVKKGYYFNIGKENKMSFVYVDDLCEAIILCFNNKMKNETFIITDGNVSSMKQFSELIARELGVRKPFTFPLWFAYAVAFGFKVLGFFGAKQLLDFSRIRTLTKNEGYDISKARRILGYSPKVDLREGVKRTVEWYRTRGMI